MNNGLYSVFDTKARVFLPPWISLNDDTARRDFAGAVNQHGHQFNRYAADYILFRIGNYDDLTGITENEHHLSLGLAQTFKETNHAGNGITKPA